MTELEKENAELKEQNRNLLESCEGATMMYKDLCKAKEIIQELVHEISVLYIATDRIVISPTVKQAEQFLENYERSVMQIKEENENCNR